MLQNRFLGGKFKITCTLLVVPAFLARQVISLRRDNLNVLVSLLALHFQWPWVQAFPDYKLAFPVQYIQEQLVHVSTIPIALNLHIPEVKALVEGRLLT